MIWLLWDGAGTWYRGGEAWPRDSQGNNKTSAIFQMVEINQSLEDHSKWREVDIKSMLMLLPEIAHAIGFDGQPDSGATYFFTPATCQPHVSEDFRRPAAAYFNWEDSDVSEEEQKKYEENAKETMQLWEKYMGHTGRQPWPLIATPVLYNTVLLPQWRAANVSDHRASRALRAVPRHRSSGSSSCSSCSSLDPNRASASSV
jgi:hypothetical protein